MQAKRFKEMPVNQFQEVMKRNWVPVQLTGNNVPSFLRRIPDGVLHSVYASGTVFSGLSFTGEPEPFRLGNHIGGIEVYRNAPDDPVNLNKDLYAVFANIGGPDTMLLVAGPLEDKEHWLDEIPERLEGVEVLLTPPQQND